MEFLKNGVTFQQIMINVTLNLKLAVIGRTSLVRSVSAATTVQNFLPVKLVARYAQSLNSLGLVCIPIIPIISVYYQ